MYLKPTSTHIIHIQSSDLNGKEPQVLSVNKHVFYGKNSNRKVAFLFNHATGYHKEILHPVMRRFRNHLRSLKEYQQTDITFLSWDDRHHGDSALLNEGRLDDTHSPTDNAMDTKQLVDKFHLKTEHDFLIGVGHSMGGSTLLLCEHYFPGTFDGLCLIEPIAYATLNDATSSLRLLMGIVAKRKDKWKDITEFRQTSLSKQLFKQFHPEAFEAYASHGVYKPNPQTVRLKCSKESEQVLYRNSSFDAFLCSVALRNLIVPTQLVLASKSTFMPRRQQTNPFENLDRNVVVKMVHGTHMFPNEEPDAVIPHLMDLIRRVNTKGNQLLFKAVL